MTELWLGECVRRINWYCDGTQHRAFALTTPSDGSKLTHETFHESPCDGACALWRQSNGGIQPPIVRDEQEFMALP